MKRCGLGVLALFCMWILPAKLSAWQVPEGVVNTQNPKDQPPPAEEMLKGISLPEGYRVSLFAAEPAVHQPIAFTFDERGRLWVAECYSYNKWDREGKTGLDRILILEDADGDGKFDKRTIFADKLANLSGLEVGFGGVWACCAPNLLFFPNADRNDSPDGPPVVKLDGWIVGNVGHNIFNGLTWGPDGWLYGLHGIQDESNVGEPGAADDKRTKLRCCVWRYHPTQKTFDVVCQGTTNPWGLDFDDYGEGFFTNCVIGHLWHMIPGAHFKRMYGEDYLRHAYELIDQHADHLHWAGEKWSESRGRQEEHLKLGGGHAHVGAMVYLGDNWPQKYRSNLFTVNLHGRRLNADKLERVGSGYVGKRDEDLFFVADPWFRGVTVKYGPDGGVYVSDWCDLGECHDNDGVHRTSGRIFKAVYQDPPKVAADLDLSKMSDAELVKLQLHTNDWYVRQARRVLQERAAAGKSMQDVHAAALAIFTENESVPRKLRAMWLLYVTGGADEAFLLAQLSHPAPEVRRWAVRLLVEEQKPSAKTLEQFAVMAKTDDAQSVRLALASALQRMPLDARWPIAMELVQHEADNDDHNLPLMIWYGIEPAVAADRPQGLKLAGKSKLSKVRQFVAKRIAAGGK